MSAITVRESELPDDPAWGWLYARLIQLEARVAAIESATGLNTDPVARFGGQGSAEEELDRGTPQGRPR